MTNRKQRRHPAGLFPASSRRVEAKPTPPPEQAQVTLTAVQAAVLDLAGGFEFMALQTGTVAIGGSREAWVAFTLQASARNLFGILGFLAQQAAQQLPAPTPKLFGADGAALA